MTDNVCGISSSALTDDVAIIETIWYYSHFSIDGFSIADDKIKIDSQTIDISKLEKYIVRKMCNCHECLKCKSKDCLTTLDCSNGRPSTDTICSDVTQTRAIIKRVIYQITFPVFSGMNGIVNIPYTVINPRKFIFTAITYFRDYDWLIVDVRTDEARKRICDVIVETLLYLKRKGENEMKEIDIESMQKEIEELRKKIKEQEKISKYNDMASELRAVMEAMKNNGFTEEQAFQLMLAAASNGSQKSSKRQSDIDDKLGF